MKLNLVCAAGHKHYCPPQIVMSKVRDTNGEPPGGNEVHEIAPECWVDPDATHWCGHHQCKEPLKLLDS
jgi:hypothetical protein